MADPFLGEIKMFGFNYAPKNWAHCNGQALLISQSTALYSLLSTNYGGDGKTTFKLPDLRGRVPVHASSESVAGRTSYKRGETAGAETVALTVETMPSHNHGGTLFTTKATGTSKEISRSVPAQLRINKTLGNLYRIYAPGIRNAVVNPNALSPAGFSLPHENRMPFLAIHYIIATEGIYPSPA
ncbi:tail fiber protein [Armatimonas sp.]|uniref:phage tail protein n=1 Tax=Armatimonas sp. TaxID=1872638 RepID=UPI00286CD327|nr:tail fiber protein [Armatimonas sp.]